MAKFSGGTFKDGVLSYVYEAKPGGRKNNINIKNINGEWFFVDKKGKVRDKLANKGKLSKTHIDNLKGAPGSSEENIFASANVSSETGKIADPGDNVNTDRELYRTISDYIAGMTDRYAVMEHKRLYDLHGGWTGTSLYDKRDR